MPAVSVLKVYFFGTALSLLALLYGLVDSVGGLMFAQAPYQPEDEWAGNIKASSPLRTHSKPRKHIGL